MNWPSEAVSQTASSLPGLISGLTAMGPIVIGAAVVYIAWRQWKTEDIQKEIDEKRLRHELFNRQETVFLATIEFLRSFYIEEEIRVEYFANFQKQSFLAYFLFDSETTAWLAEIRNRYSDVLNNTDDAADSLQWLKRQNVEIVNKFKPHMNLRY